ncbi:MAG TPA: hypothetical protein PKD55_02070 [Bellilinea sp.]|nr:hypothetical protein [Bellilinea sp.]
MKLESLAIILVVAAAAGIFVFFRLKLAKEKVFGLRKIEAVEQIEHSIGMALEEASQVHISLGTGSLTDPTGLSNIAVANAAREMSRVSAMTDKPPVFTSGDALTTLIVQSEVEVGYFQSQFPDQFDAASVQQSGTTPLAYAAAAMQTATGEPINANILLGTYGPEAGLISFQSAAQEADTITGGNNLEAQAAFYATSDADLIGEEIYALPAYLSRRPQQLAGIKTQDILRWGVLIVLVGGSLLKVLSVL